MVDADDDIVDADGWAADGVARVLTSGDEVRFSAEQFGLVSADAARPELNIVKNICRCFQKSGRAHAS